VIEAPAGKLPGEHGQGREPVRLAQLGEHGLAVGQRHRVGDALPLGVAGAGGGVVAFQECHALALAEEPDPLLLHLGVQDERRRYGREAVLGRPRDPAGELVGQVLEGDAERHAGALVLPALAGPEDRRHAALLRQGPGQLPGRGAVQQVEGAVEVRLAAAVGSDQHVDRLQG
jgi:hypothetical protein